ncbi:MAG: hypothetical protein JSV03_04410 [Planctomycetota bacterium]|nr:MAG: hypothetical protein JSV03_04410 [Planctomycetota bacterium]
MLGLQRGCWIRGQGGLALNQPSQAVVSEAVDEGAEFAADNLTVFGEAD